MNRLGLVRKKADVTQRELAQRVGVHWVTISKLERGAMALTMEWAERLAPALGVNPENLLLDEPSLTVVTVDITGNIIEGGTGEAHEAGGRSTQVINNPDDPQQQWFRVWTDQLSPTLHKFDCVKVLWDEYDDRNLYVGFLCAVSTTGDDVNFGYLSRGSKEPLWNLHRLSGPLLRNVELRRIGRVSAVLFAGYVEEEDAPYPSEIVAE